MIRRYVELRASSAFSFLRGSSSPEDLVSTAADMGMHSIALADSGGVYGMPRFVKACRENGVRPICGAKINLDTGIRGRDNGPDVTGELLLLCRDVNGWANLCEILTVAHSGREKDTPLADMKMIERYSAGLVCIAGGMDGPVVRTATARDRESGRATAERLAGIFGIRNLFLDLQRHGDPAQERANRFIADVAESIGVDTIATNDVRYSTASRSRVYDVFKAIRKGTTLDSMGADAETCHRRFIRSSEEMSAIFGDMPKIIDRTADLAESLRFDLADIGYRFPEYPVSPPRTEFMELRDLVEQGIPGRYPKITPAIRSQIDHELGIIGKLGLSGYFLLVNDICRFCRDKEILAQGRGSAANSAVCYVLGITAVDPIGMGLLFERFLSEERGEWPDIDLDLPSGDKREKVIQHVYEKYGPRHVGMTAAFSTFRGRSAVRQAGAALGLAPDSIAKLARLVRHFEFRDDDDTITDKARQAGLDTDDPAVTGFLDVWHDMQDLPRHIGQHNGGLVISGTRLDRIVPIVPARMPGRMVIQWDKDDLADMRLIKVDLLGLGMLNVISETVDLVARHHGHKIDLAHLPTDDRPVWDMLCRADTVGVFQIESRAQMATLPRMKPRCFYDLVIEIAIIRPGPIVGRMVHPFLNRRSGREPIRYADPCLKPILERTLGIPLFQEQLMRMAMTAADFSGGQAEELRRAMGSRRSRARMQALIEQMHHGMTQKGIDKSSQDEIVNSIVSFALYGFPESHAASFALIAWASSWLKHHYPAAFTASILNCWPMGFYSPATLVSDVIRHGVTVMPIDVNRSMKECTLEKAVDGTTAIRMGLKFIRGLRETSIESIVSRRLPDKPFRDVTELGIRTGVGRAELMLLADAGAVPCALNGLSKKDRRFRRRDALWQAMAFDPSETLLHESYEPDAAFDEEYLPAPIPESQNDVIDDFRATGLTTGPHPASFIRQRLDALHALRSCELPLIPNGSRAAVGGMVIVRQRPPTARGFYFATVEDEAGHAAIAVRADLFAANRSLLSDSTFMVFEGTVQNRDGVTSLLADTFQALDAPIETRARNFH